MMIVHNISIQALIYNERIYNLNIGREPEVEERVMTTALLNKT